MRLDDRFPDHPKVDALSNGAFRLHVRALCYCSEHLTDGRVPHGMARRFGSLKCIGELMTQGLWTDKEDGYYIHDYLDYNPSKERVLSIRAARSNAARTRWGTILDDGSSDANALQPLLGAGTGRGRGLGFVHPLDEAIGDADAD